MKPVAALLLCLPLCAQNFRILPSTPQGGAEGSIAILLISPPGGEPIALQWKVTLSAGATVDAGGITEGDSAAAAGKRILCSQAPGSTKATPTLGCILAGGQKSMANGVAFQIKYHRAADARPGSAMIRISDAIAVSGPPDRLKKADIPAVSASVDAR